MEYRAHSSNRYHDERDVSPNGRISINNYFHSQTPDSPDSTYEGTICRFSRQENDFSPFSEYGSIRWSDTDRRRISPNEELERENYSSKVYSKELNYRICRDRSTEGGMISLDRFRSRSRLPDEGLRSSLRPEEHYKGSSRSLGGELRLSRERFKSHSRSPEGRLSSWDHMESSSISPGRDMGSRQHFRRSISCKEKGHCPPDELRKRGRSRDRRIPQECVSQSLIPESGYKRNETKCHKTGRYTDDFRHHPFNRNKSRAKLSEPRKPSRSDSPSLDNNVHSNLRERRNKRKCNFSTAPENLSNGKRTQASRTSPYSYSARGTYGMDRVGRESASCSYQTRDRHSGQHQHYSPIPDYLEKEKWPQVGNVIMPRTNIKICYSYTQNVNIKDCNCHDLHVCKFYLVGKCFGETDCKFNHNVYLPHNEDVLKRHFLHKMKPEKVREILSDVNNRNSSTSPTVCKFYNNKGGCKQNDRCQHLHVCLHFVTKNCKFRNQCKRDHGFLSPHSLNILDKYGLSEYRYNFESLFELIRNNLNNGTIQTRKLNAKNRKPEIAQDVGGIPIDTNTHMPLSSESKPETSRYFDLDKATEHKQKTGEKDNVEIEKEEVYSYVDYGCDNAVVTKSPTNVETVGNVSQTQNNKIDSFESLTNNQPISSHIQIVHEQKSNCQNTLDPIEAINTFVDSIEVVTTDNFTRTQADASGVETGYPTMIKTETICAFAVDNDIKHKRKHKNDRKKKSNKCSGNSCDNVVTKLPTTVINAIRVNGTTTQKNKTVIFENAATRQGITRHTIYEHEQKTACPNSLDMTAGNANLVNGTETTTKDLVKKNISLVDDSCTETWNPTMIKIESGSETNNTDCIQNFQEMETDKTVTNLKENNEPSSDRTVELNDSDYYSLGVSNNKGNTGVLQEKRLDNGSSECHGNEEKLDKTVQIKVGDKTYKVRLHDETVDVEIGGNGDMEINNDLTGRLKTATLNLMDVLQELDTKRLGESREK